MKRYVKKDNAPVTAVQFDLVFGNTGVFCYKKWGSVQTARPGDWLVNNNGEVYTVDKDSFAKTYEEVSPGRYRKKSVVHAYQASIDGAIRTKEGTSQYVVGDYIVFNDAKLQDGYAVEKTIFESIYEPAP